MKKLLFLIMLLAATGPLFAQKTYNLQFKPQAGAQYNANIATKSTITQSMMGQDMVINMDFDIGMLYDITKAAENTGLGLTYEKLNMKMKMMGQDITMSSEDTDDSNPGSQPLKALKGARVSLIMNGKGEVVDVNGTEELINRFGDISAMQKETLKGFISKESIKGTTEMSMKIFPGRPVKVGDSWTLPSVVETPYKLTSNNTYKLLKVENGVAYIDMTGAISTGGPQTMQSNGMEMKVDLTGDQNASFQVDEATGISKQTRLTQNLKGKMEVMGQEVPMTMVTRSEASVIKK